MDCQRCHGLMVQDRAYDFQDTNIHCDVYRCVCCGNLIDTLILMNQAKLVAQVHPIQKVYVSQDRAAA